MVERSAGGGAGISDHEFARAGAHLSADREAIFRCPLLVKVKELQREEWPLLHPGTTVFGFAQLGRDPALLEAVLAAGIDYVAYETVCDDSGALPILSPMSRIAGRLAPVIGARLLMSDCGGSGVLLSGIDDVAPGVVVIVGAGNAGLEAARVAASLRCAVTVFVRSERAVERVRALGQRTIEVATCGQPALASAIVAADIVIGAVLEPGKLSPKLITRGMVGAMRRGSILIDVGIDQGGIAETSHMTKLSEPTYEEQGVLHYCVPNMPALVPRTASFALGLASLPYVDALARLGTDAAVAADAGLRQGLQIRRGRIVHPGLLADAEARTGAGI
jgi:alanine dehydrogenase